MQLTDTDAKYAAEMIGCEPEVIKAIAEVEAPKGGFIEDGIPVILFEPYIFGDRTKQRFNNYTVTINGIKYPLSKNRRVSPWSVKNANYGPSKIQHQKLQAAIDLDKNAAIESTSWGAFQILGQNYKLCGCKTADEFVSKMSNSEKDQLVLFINFIKASKLDDELKNKDWEGFAYKYNGPKQDKGTSDETDDYDFFLKKAYLRFKKEN